MPQPQVSPLSPLTLRSTSSLTHLSLSSPLTPLSPLTSLSPLTLNSSPLLSCIQQWRQKILVFTHPSSSFQLVPSETTSFRRNHIVPVSRLCCRLQDIGIQDLLRPARSLSSFIVLRSPMFAVVEVQCTSSRARRSMTLSEQLMVAGGSEKFWPVKKFRWVVR